MSLRIPKKVIFGQRFPLYGTGFRPNVEEKINLKYHDTVNSCFEFEKNVKTDNFGRLHLSEMAISDMISLAKTEKCHDPFILEEFSSTKLELELGGLSHLVEISSGVGENIVKEEIREDGIVANVYYPKNGKNFPGILHINGSLNHIQDARAIRLAREGFIVMEIAYNGEFLPRVIFNVGFYLLII